jgi:peptidoglycan/LPS O-acetylase OafA/YrhL
MKYRPEIDGLRAVAVIPVVLSHAGIPGLPAGFLGVDVFFVISGFLITSILLAEFESGRFSMLSFYDRRARRILPPLAVMLLLGLPVAWMVMLPSQLKDLGQSIVATLCFAANVYFWLTQDYWSQAAEITPFIHLWSLGVEEQFYVVFPIVLGLLHRRPRVLFATLAVLALASLALMLAARSKGYGAAAFYLLPFRSWELLAGALSALAARRRGERAGDRPAVTAASLALIIASYAMLRPSSHPLLLYVPVVLATSFILVLCRSGSSAGALLAVPFLTWIGKVSYSLYLFHQPVLAFARLRFGLDLSPLVVAASLVAIGVLSALSYFMVEVPFRRRDTVSRSAFVASLVAGAIVLGAFGWSARRTNGFWESKIAGMSPAGRDALAKLQDAVQERTTVWKRFLDVGSKDFDDSGCGRVLFVGDSLSEDLFIVASLAGCSSPALQFRRIALDNECIESQAPGRTGVNDRPCADEMRRFLESSLLLHSDCIVIAAAWLETARSLTNLLDLPELDGKCVLIYEPHGFTNVKSLIAYMDREAIRPDSESFRAYAFVTRHHRTEQSNAILEEIASERGLAIYRGFDCFCDRIAGTCQLFDGAGHPLIIDQAHLSVRGAQRMGASLCDAIRNAMTKRREMPSRE